MVRIWILIITIISFSWGEQIWDIVGISACLSSMKNRPSWTCEAYPKTKNSSSKSNMIANPGIKRIYMFFPTSAGTDNILNATFGATSVLLRCTPLCPFSVLQKTLLTPVNVAFTVELSTSEIGTSIDCVSPTLGMWPVIWDVVRLSSSIRLTVSTLPVSIWTQAMAALELWSFLLFVFGLVLTSFTAYSRCVSICSLPFGWRFRRLRGFVGFKGHFFVIWFNFPQIWHDFEAKLI